MCGFPTQASVCPSVCSSIHHPVRRPYRALMPSSTSAPTLRWTPWTSANCGFSCAERPIVPTVRRRRLWGILKRGFALDNYCFVAQRIDACPSNRPNRIERVFFEWHLLELRQWCPRVPLGVLGIEGVRAPLPWPYMGNAPIFGRSKQYWRALGGGSATDKFKLLCPLLLSSSVKESTRPAAVRRRCYRSELYVGSTVDWYRRALEWDGVEVL